MPLDIIDEIRPRKEERSLLREIASYVVGLLALVALGVAATWPTKANAQPQISKAGKDYVRLMDDPCTMPALIDLLKANDKLDALKFFKTAEADIGGSHFAACWRKSVSPEGLYIIFYEDGDHAVVSQDEFQPEGV